MVSPRTALAPAVLFTLLPFSAGAGPEPVHRADLEAGRIVSAVIDPAPTPVTGDSAHRPQERPQEPIPPRRKLHPRLLALVDGDAPGTVNVVIPFEDKVEIPRFPALDPRFPRKDAKNAPARATAERLVRELREKRADTYRQRAAELERNGAKVIETFWLIDAVVAETPVSSLLRLADREEVLAIVPVDSGEPPPDDGNPRNDVEDGRARIASDPHFELSGGFIGLLDTGVRDRHWQFNEPSTIDLKLDCVHGGDNCAGGGNPDDDCWNHGTSSAAILTGNARLGGPFRGVTKITVDSFKVYPSVFDGKLCDSVASGLDTVASVRAFQAAVAALDKVIVAQIAQVTENGPIAQAANAAFKAGAVVVAANGNEGTGSADGSVTEPANTSRVLGVGNFSVIDDSQIATQGRGPGIDGRIKPDFQAPTLTETAGNGCRVLRNCSGVFNDKALRSFGGTSGATPYAAGAAALMLNLVASAMKTDDVDPGFVYALMILSGQRTSFDNDHGVGELRLPADGSLLWGFVDVRHGDVFEVPVMVLPHRKIKIIDAALWWPEDWGRHNNVDLAIDGPSDPPGKSESVPSVFERARITDPKNGKWRITIHGKRIPLGPQRVYFAILVQPPPTTAMD